MDDLYQKLDSFEIIFSGGANQLKEKSSLATNDNLKSCFQIGFRKIESVPKRNLSKEEEKKLALAYQTLKKAERTWIAKQNNQETWEFLEKYFVSELFVIYPFNCKNPWNSDFKQSLRGFFFKGQEATLIKQGKSGIEYVVLGKQEKKYRLLNLKQIKKASLLQDHKSILDSQLLRKLDEENYISVSGKKSKSSLDSSDVSISLLKKFQTIEDWVFI